MPRTPLLLLLAAMTALPATAQPLPDFPPGDGLPPGLELCGGPIVPDLPFGEPWPAVSAATDLEYRITIGDMATAGAEGRPTKINEYTHRGGGVIVGSNGYSTGSGVINDTTAFPCNP